MDGAFALTEASGVGHCLFPSVFHHEMFPLEEEIQLEINCQCPSSGRECSARTALIY